jgi:hypothetical protein
MEGRQQAVYNCDEPARAGLAEVHPRFESL